MKAHMLQNDVILS